MRAQGGCWGQSPPPSCPEDSRLEFLLLFFSKAQGTKDGKPKQKVIISDCGECP